MSIVSTARGGELISFSPGENEPRRLQGTVCEHFPRDRQTRFVISTPPFHPPPSPLRSSPRAKPDSIDRGRTKDRLPRLQGDSRCTADGITKPRFADPRGLPFPLDNTSLFIAPARRERTPARLITGKSIVSCADKSAQLHRATRDSPHTTSYPSRDPRDSCRGRFTPPKDRNRTKRIRPDYRSRPA